MGERAAILDDPYVRGLIAQALKVAGVDLKRGNGDVVLKSRIRTSLRSPAGSPELPPNKPLQPSPDRATPSRRG